VVRLEDGRVLRCARTFFIGRDSACEVCIQDSQVSRRHAQVSFEQGEWSIRDLQSSNGIFVGGEPVESAPIGRGLSLTLGLDGPLLRIEPEKSAAGPTAPRRPSEPAPAGEPGTLEEYADHYLREDEGPAGVHTMMIRKAFQQQQALQKQRRRQVISLLTFMVCSMAAFAVYQRYQIASQERKIAAHREDMQNIFYIIKEQDLAIARIELKPSASSAESSRNLLELRNKRREIEERYNRGIAELYDRQLSRKDRLILKVTRTFGECDIAAPPEYIKEVTAYIDKWRTGNRFKKAVKRAQDNDYVSTIVNEFTANGLPPQFFYLGMQESDFNPRAVGHPTRWGIAKGMWQFIPDTGRTYGLAIGPLKASSDYDPADARFDWRQATGAAARYVKSMYATDAQASGLLVIASYNWGERRVIDLLKEMPSNPKERNFWKFLERYRGRVPDETYNYVFYIVAAAVIGEDPAEFGIDAPNPLQAVSQTAPVS
jgi:hypothetical protein